MHPLIKEIEDRLDYKYRGFSDKGYKFTKSNDNESQPNQYYHYFTEDICELCEKPNMKRKYTKKRNHRNCNNIMMVREYK